MKFSKRQQPLIRKTSLWFLCVCVCFSPRHVSSKWQPLPPSTSASKALDDMHSGIIYFLLKNSYWFWNQKPFSYYLYVFSKINNNFSIWKYRISTFDYNWTSHCVAMVKRTYFRDMSLDEIQVASIFFATKYLLTPHSDQKYVICHQFTVKTCPHPFLCSSLCGSNVTFYF